MAGEIRLRCKWEVKTKNQATGLYEVQLARYNTWSNYGLSALAAVPGGQPYAAPQYLAIEANGDPITNSGGITAGATSCTSNANPMESGDTQIILSVGTANQETVTVSSVTGTGPYTFNFPACTKNHAYGDLICRVPLAADTMSSLQNEWQYDSVNAPNQRLFTSAGYSTGTGVWVMQFYYNGSQAIGNFTTIGVCDSQTVGSGNLHNHVALGYTHVSGEDLEIDGTLTLVN